MPQIQTTFGLHSTAEEVVNGIDLSDARIIVTGDRPVSESRPPGRWLSLAQK